MGFANFYWRFIGDYTWVAAPLTQLTSPTFPFVWTSNAEATFSKTLVAFFLCSGVNSSGPISAVCGRGRCLQYMSRCYPLPMFTCGQQDPCTFFSSHLSPAERNYDVGNQELLAVVLALQEWRHWLEGTNQPFIVWTDHKNLAYL